MNIKEILVTNVKVKSSPKKRKFNYSKYMTLAENFRPFEPVRKDNVDDYVKSLGL